MGSFNVSCSLSGDYISSEEEVVVIPLFQTNSNDSLGIYSWDYYAPCPVMMEGTYNSYGGINEVKIFDSQNSLSEEENAKSTKGLLSFFKSYLHINSEPITDISDCIGMSVSFVKKDGRVAMLELLLREVQKAEEDKQHDAVKQIKQTLNTFFNFQSLEEAKEFCEQRKDLTHEQTMNFMYFKKSKLLSLLNNYGVVNGEIDKDVYAQHLQKCRAGKEDAAEDVKFVSGGGGYAGENRPKFTWESIASSVKGKTREICTKLHRNQGLDLALVNDYFSLLGKPWTPSVTISEDAQHYGHAQALEMQKSLVAEELPTKKPKAS